MEHPAPNSAYDQILKTFKEKSCMKQDVYRITQDKYNLFKTALQHLVDRLSGDFVRKDDRIVIGYESKSPYEARLNFAGDTLFFLMHTNVFQLDESHPAWKTSYVKEDPMRAYCGMINVYNFLADSFKYNRVNDSGYLVARIFINRDEHFLVEGKRQLGFKFNDFVNATLDEAAVQDIIETCIQYSLDFDLLVPPYENMKLVSVHQMQELAQSMKIRTAKRLGFRFHNESDQIT